MAASDIAFLKPSKEYSFEIDALEFVIDDSILPPFNLYEQLASVMQPLGDRKSVV